MLFDILLFLVVELGIIIYFRLFKYKGKFRDRLDEIYIIIFKSGFNRAQESYELKFVY